MKTSKAIIIFGILVLVGSIFYSLSNRYYISGAYIIDKFSGNVRLVRDVIVSTPAPAKTETSSWKSDDFKAKSSPSVEPYKGDFSKVVISGEATNVSQYMYEITCTVKNSDSISHKLTVKAIFYDKNKKPILTEESISVIVGSDDIESVTITAFNSVKNISSYELKLSESKTGVLK